MKNIPYTYQNCPIPGGGYVTGFTYHPQAEGLVYLRTDIGGTYRWDREKNRWVSLIDHVTMLDASEAYVSGLAVCPENPGRLYIACGLAADRETGTERNGILAVSEDYGETFSYYPLPCPVHGNWPGRGAGSRLVVDRNHPDVIYFASQRAGLLRSLNRGQDWESISIAKGKNNRRNNELNLAFIWVCPLISAGGLSQLLVLSADGLDNASLDGMAATRQDIMNCHDTEKVYRRGHSLYISADAGKSWEPLPMPITNSVSGAKVNGLVGHRYDYDGRYLYVTLTGSGRSATVNRWGYACDSGDCCGGMVLRYPLADWAQGLKTRRGGSSGIPLAPVCENITPTGTKHGYTKDGVNNAGFGGISSCPLMPGLLAVSTICEKRGDVVFISRDYGDSYEVSLLDLDKDNLRFHTPYMKPEYNGGHSIVHWLSDIKINPFDPDDVLATTGTGVFGTRNFTAAACVWEDRCAGVEETVHLNVYSPPAGAAQVIDMVGDLGGFVFTDLNRPCENSFADRNHDRYITCINADYSDFDPACLIVTPRGNWTGQTTGGLILSKDQGQTFTHLPLPYGITPRIDALLAGISRPNVNSGWVAMGPDCRTIVWSLAEKRSLPLEAVVYSHDGGQTFAKCRFIDSFGQFIVSGYVKIFADRVNARLMYGFSSSRLFFISRDSGKTFRQYPLPENVPDFFLAAIDTSDASSIWVESGKEGVIYLSLLEHGIWKYVYDAASDGVSCHRLTQAGDVCYKMGLGLLRPDADYIRDAKAIYAAAVIRGEYGFYCSFDDCRTWTRINSGKQMYGRIHAIAGDARRFGRFYIATGSRGLLYGEPA